MITRLLSILHWPGVTCLTNVIKLEHNFSGAFLIELQKGKCPVLFFYMYELL